MCFDSLQYLDTEADLGLGRVRAGQAALWVVWGDDGTGTGFPASVSEIQTGLPHIVATSATERPSCD